MRTQAEICGDCLIKDSDLETQSRMIECLKNNISVFGYTGAFPCDWLEPIDNQFPTIAEFLDGSILVFDGELIRAYK